jgi:hypothetical protein
LKRVSEKLQQIKVTPVAKDKLTDPNKGQVSTKNNNAKKINFNEKVNKIETTAKTSEVSNFSNLKSSKLKDLSTKLKK